MSLQVKFGLSYVAIIIAVLVLMNTYPLTASEDLVFRSKESTLKNSVSVMTTALMGQETLTEENVATALTVTEETGISRVLVTDEAGRILYDSRETDNAQGRYAFYTEIVQALHGNDVFFAAYEGGAAWLDECRTYIRGNLDYLRGFLAERLPEIRLVEPEGTYFAWLDCSGLGLSPEALNDLVLDKARVWLDEGSLFGESGGQFQRVVLACTRNTLHEALERIEAAVRQHRAEKE